MRRSFHVVRAKHRGEVISYRIVRTAFLRHVVADTRTRDLIESWGRTYGVDAAIADVSLGIDLITRVINLPSPVALLTEPDVITAQGICGHIRRLDALMWQRVAETQSERAGDMVRFVADLRDATAGHRGGTGEITWQRLDASGTAETVLANAVRLDRRLDDAASDAGMFVSSPVLADWVSNHADGEKVPSDIAIRPPHLQRAQ
jgi:hypothetical protein